jgi:hypothetical protein
MPMCRPICSSQSSMQWIHCSPCKRATLATGGGNSRVSVLWWVASDESAGGVVAVLLGTSFAAHEQTIRVRSLVD